MLSTKIQGVCEEAFERSLGYCNLDCKSSLQQAVQRSILLRVRLLHPEIKYEFDYQEGVNVFTAGGLPMLRGKNWPIILPRIRRDDIDIVKPLALLNRSDCNLCKKDIYVNEVEIMEC